MSATALADALDIFARVSATIPEARMTVELPPSSAPDDAPWTGYTSVREIYYRVYQDLRALAARRASARQQTRAQRIVAQHQLAWRDLCGALAGVADTELDRAPAPEEWPLRTVLEHMFEAERGFWGLTNYALRRARSHPEWPLALPDSVPELDAVAIDVSGGLADILGRFGALHARVVADFSGVTDAELDAPSGFWEDEPQVVAFRLHRFDAHLREHTIQVDKTLPGIGHPPSEAERLTRLLYNALGEAEGAALGAPDDGHDAPLAATVRRLAGRLT